MLNWTIRALFTAPQQLLASVSAVAGSFALVLFFEAVFAGESNQIVAYIDNSDADVWVMQSGVANMHMANSFLSDWKIDRVAAVDGVQKVTPILYLNTAMQAGGRDWFAFVVGLEVDDPRAGPWDIVAGNSQPGPGEAIVPSVFADIADVQIGDSVQIAGRDFAVSGLSGDTFSMANSIAFVTFDDLSDLMSTIGSVSYLLVDAAPGVAPGDLADRIRDEVEKVNAIAKPDFVANDWAVAIQMGLEIVAIMTVICSAVAVLLTSYIIYSYVTESEREIAVMKALGVRNYSIYLGIMLQAVIITALAFALGTAVVFAGIPLTEAFVPQVSLWVTVSALLRVGLAAFVVSILAAIVPVRRVLQVDPVSAFKD